MNTILYFTADWCGPCKKVRPIVEEVKREYQDANIFIIDADVESEMVKDFEIKSIPTFIVLNNNKEIHRTTGAQTKKQLEDLVDFGK